jgi:hypothetical protein
MVFFHSLRIEFKTEKGKQQPSQKEWQELVEKYGNKYVICRSFDEFRNTIKQYLAL